LKNVDTDSRVAEIEDNNSRAEMHQLIREDNAFNKAAVKKEK
jgi:hypothetical protein